MFLSHWSNCHVTYQTSFRNIMHFFSCWAINKLNSVDLNYLHTGNFFMLLSSAVVFFNHTFFKKIFQEYYQCQNSLYPDLGPNSLQRLSADDTCM